MKRIFLAIQILCLLFCTAQCKKNHVYTCEIDTSKTGYELAEAYDNCTVWNAQKTMTHIEYKDIDIRATRLDKTGFEGSYAALNAEENWIQPFYMITQEDMSAYPDAPASINGVIQAKFKAKDAVDAAFDFPSYGSQGICADVQKDIYDTVYGDILTREQRSKYRSEGKRLLFIPDDDLPPLTDNSTNPVRTGQAWLTVDPATKFTRDPYDNNTYYYEPWSTYVSFDDPDISDDFLKGIRYCKLLSHQAILSWMLEKSFEENPVLITPTETVCDAPSALESDTNGSCLLYFGPAQKYYCSDFTGPAFTPATAQEKCETSPTYRTPNYPDPVYSISPCSQRTAEIEAYIPAGYLGLTGICVIHCNEENEFIWNIYTADPESSCTGFDFFTPEELGK